VTQSQEVNILTCNTAHEVWKNLEVANRSQGSRTMLAYGRKLYHTTAGERDNIIEHLDKLKKYRQQINFAASGDKQLEISDSSFIRSSHNRCLRRGTRLRAITSFRRHGIWTIILEWSAPNNS
jgi:hypothetical protein